MTQVQRERKEHSDWHAIAQSVLAGDYDEPAKSSRHRSRPPQESMAETLRMGLRGYQKCPICLEALQHINQP